jgi:tetrahydromethanopterin S-methyltransferase subunit G
VKYSGAIPAKEVNEIVERIEKLQRAVKFAREEANRTTALQQEVGAKVLKYVFG